MAGSDDTLRRVDETLDALAEGARYRPSRLPPPTVDTRDLGGVDSFLDTLGEPKSLADLPLDAIAAGALSGRPPAPRLSSQRSSSLPPESWASRPSSAWDERLPSSVRPSPSGSATSRPPPASATAPAPSVPPFLSEPGPRHRASSVPASVPPDEDAPPTDLELRIPEAPPAQTANALASTSLRDLFGEDPDNPDAGSVVELLPTDSGPYDSRPPSAPSIRSTTPPPGGARSSLPEASSLWPSQAPSAPTRSEAGSRPLTVPHPSDPPGPSSAPDADAADDEGFRDFAPTPIRSVSSVPEPPRAASVPPPPPEAVPDEVSDALSELDDLIFVEPEPEVEVEPADLRPPAPESHRAHAAAAGSAPPPSDYEDALDDLLQFTDEDVTSLPASRPGATRRSEPPVTSFADRSDPSLEIAVDELLADEPSLGDDPWSGEIMSDDSVARAVSLAPEEPSVNASVPPAPSAPPVSSAPLDVLVDEDAGSESPDDDEDGERHGFFSRLFGRK